MNQPIEKVSLEEMRDELKREIKMRERVYPHWVETKRIEPRIAELQMLRIRAALGFIETELRKNQAQGELFELPECEFCGETEEKCLHFGS